MGQKGFERRQVYKVNVIVIELYIYTRKNLTSCSKSANKLCLEQFVNSCNNLVDTIRLVARLFQHVRYSHEITILLQPCVVDLVTFLLYHDGLEQPCNKSDNANKLVLQVVNSLFQTCYNNWEQVVRTQLVDNL